MTHGSNWLSTNQSADAPRQQAPLVYGRGKLFLPPVAGGARVVASVGSHVRDEMSGSGGGGQNFDQAKAGGGWRSKFPFTAEQMVNIFSEMGPVFAMFIANGIGGIKVGIVTLIVCTIAGLILSFAVLKRPPLMPFIAGSVTIVFGLLSWYTEDPMWVQVKVTIFNLIVAVMLWGGLKTGRNFFHFIFGKTFHYTPDGWYLLTRNVAIFFLITAIANEAVRLGFDDAAIFVPSFDVWKFAIPQRVLYGIDIWILFKLVVVMPLTGLFLYWQVRRLQQHRLPDQS